MTTSDRIFEFNMGLTGAPSARLTVCGRPAVHLYLGREHVGSMENPDSLRAFAHEILRVIGDESPRAQGDGAPSAPTSGSPGDDAAGTTSNEEGT